MKDDVPLLFVVTHKKRSDNRYVGTLPGADKGYVNYAYKAPKDGGQSFRMKEDEFNRRFMRV